MELKCETRTKRISINSSRTYMSSNSNTLPKVMSAACCILQLSSPLRLLDGKLPSVIPYFNIKSNLSGFPEETRPSARPLAEFYARHASAPVMYAAAVAPTLINKAPWLLAPLHGLPGGLAAGPFIGHKGATA